MTYTQAQINVALGFCIAQLEQKHREYHENGTFMKNLHGLFVKLAQCDHNGTRLSKMQAYRYIPLKNQNRRQKYFEAAVEQGFIRVEADPKDQRRSLVYATDKVKSYVDEYIRAKIDTGCEILVQMAQIAPLPDDGLPFAGLYLGPEAV